MYTLNLFITVHYGVGLYLWSFNLVPSSFLVYYPSLSVKPIFKIISTHVGHALRSHGAIEPLPSETPCSSSSTFDHTRSMFMQGVPTWEERFEFVLEIDLKWNNIARRAASAQWTARGLVTDRVWDDEYGKFRNRLWLKGKTATSLKSGDQRPRMCESECGC